VPLRQMAVGLPEPIVEGIHWGFAGTRLLTGDARLRVVFTGSETLYGEIVRSARGGALARTPLQ
jgi:Ca2+-transporting ATPase